MAISRMQQPRQMYGIGSFVKKAVRKVTRPITKVASKIVPKEIAGIMRLAAPFLGPVAGPTAYLLGTAKQTGRISPMDLALTLAPTVGRMTLPNEGRFSRFIPEGLKGNTIKGAIGKTPLPFTEKNLGELLVGRGAETRKIIGRQDKYGIPNTRSASKMEAFYETLSPAEKARFDNLNENIFGDFIPGEGGIEDFTDFGSPEKFREYERFLEKPSMPSTIFEPGTSGIFGSGGDMFKFGVKDGPSILDTKAGQTLFGKPEIINNQATGKFVPSLLKIGSTGVSLASLLRDAKTPEEAGNALVAATGNSNDYEAGVEMFSSLPEGIFDIPQQFRLNSANGGLMRTNYAIGSDDEPLRPDPTKPIQPFQPKPVGPVLPDRKMAEFNLLEYQEEFERVFPEMREKRGTEEYMDMLEDYFRGLASKDKEGIMMAKEGGRANLALGTKPTPEESGLGGLPIEADMRYTGGFMPYGEKEKADDVPARLSKNEFVFTADAVRAAGGGSVNEGAKKMYTAMKQLEKKPEAKGMMA
jgi:hypothetical protein